MSVKYNVLPTFKSGIVMFRRFLLMTQGLISNSCNGDCSGRGECQNGTCLCNIRFTGELCDDPNLPYLTGIGGTFIFIGCVCAVQLIMCCISEYHRLKTPKFLKACKITTQKMIYLVTFFASIIRGAYFIFPALEHGWSSSLLSSYYPLLMSSASLIVCFWAEVFHLPGVHCGEKSQQFISKSFMGFLTFNIISYGLLFAEFITTLLAEPPANNPGFYNHLFNGCYAVLMFIVVVFFLIYGVEVYFKVRGGFITTPFRLAHAMHESEPLKMNSDDNFHPKINMSQLHQSRFGLLSQASMQIVMAGFLFSETLSELWKTKVPINSINLHDIMFRIVELGVLTWYPATFWNCVQPSELWILNPRKLLAKFDAQKGNDVSPQDTDENHKFPSGEGENEKDFNADGKVECWICYDDKNEPLIQPCDCTGDVSSVHHECLRRWLTESSSSNNEALYCKVCKYEYQICRSTSEFKWDLTPKHWARTALIITCICMVGFCCWIIIDLFRNSYIRILAASVASIIIYVCMRCLGQNALEAYQRGRVAGINIQDHVTTISENVIISTSADETDHNDCQKPIVTKL